MAQRNSAVELTFNDNDGSAGWRCNPASAEDVLRHYVIFGKWRARWIFFKKFWKGLMWMEHYALVQYYSNRSPYYGKKPKLWVFKPEIPE